MDGRVVVAVVALVAVAGVAAPAAGGVVQSTTETPNGTATPSPNGTSASEGSFGATISSFMQASTAETKGTVDTGMWAAEFARSNASQRPELVTGRTAALERRLDELEADRTELLNDSDGNVTMAERAKASRLQARIDTLRDALNRTSVAAETAGVNTTRLERLRTETENLSGPEVAGLARGLAGNGPPDDRGPPEDGGPPENRGSMSDTEDANTTDDTNETDADGDRSENGAGTGAGTGASGTGGQSDGTDG